MTDRHAQLPPEPRRGAFLGLDVRRAALTAVVVDEEGRILSRQARETATPDAARDLLAGLAPRAIAAVGAALGDDAGAVAVAGEAASAAGVTRPARILSHGAAVALGEQWRGAGRDRAFVAALTIADGVQAGLVMHGSIFEGAHGRGGDAAWLALNPVDREDYRRVGCLDAEIGAAGIVKRLVWRIKAGDRSRVQEMAGGDLATITVPQVFAAARDGDGVAISVVRDTARYIGMAAANLATLFDPDVVILAGLIADAADLLLEPSRVEALRRVSPATAATLEIASGALGGEAAALGAARAAMLAA